MIDLLSRLDRRWIFLLMLVGIATPILVGLRFPEEPSDESKTVFETIDALENGSLVLMAFDFDPPSKGELQPMAAAFTRHCALKRHRMIFMTLWPQGTPMIQENVDILKREFPDYKYGEDYVVLGFRTGEEGVIRNVMSDLRSAYGTDNAGARLDDIDLTKNLKNFQNVKLILNVSAGTPGAKEWVQYASTPYAVTTIVGTTGVGATPLYPYIPGQLKGILAAIKAAAGYEQSILLAYPDQSKNPRSQEALRRMSPQLIGHLLIVLLIALGNVIYFAGRRRQHA